MISYEDGIFGSSPALQELFSELSKTAVLSDSFKDRIFKLSVAAVEDAYQRGVQNGIYEDGNAKKDKKK